MKQNTVLFFAIIIAGTFISCNNIDFKRTKSGLLYKIISSGNKKDSLPKPGDVLKFNVVTKLNDSVLYSTYGKMPGFSRVPEPETAHYSPAELFNILREGDSLVSVSLVDTFLKRGMGEQLPPNAKKGDRITTTFKIIKVFRNDSLARLDYDEETKKDLPRRQKEMQEEQAKAEKEHKEQQAKDMAELKSSGEMEREIKAMEAYLAAKKITATKTGDGVYVYIKQQGDGPVADSGKFVTVKYTGKHLDTDSVFQTNTYSFVLGAGQVIQGWDEGLKLFKKGGKGTIYVPGFLAYGKNPPAGSPFKVYEPLAFDIEMVDVKDSQ
ncbi:MAG TPA: FKBP-type peptidyl-prolyl cis-trans isomerase [Chitinophagaceae bacterium]|nr:FKBP-type peptidyl-prolyl cis-trans isomerase [Chitinophagaceae bacterium]